MKQFRTPNKAHGDDNSRYPKGFSIPYYILKGIADMCVALEGFPRILKEISDKQCQKHVKSMSKAKSFMASRSSHARSPTRSYNNCDWMVFSRNICSTVQSCVFLFAFFAAIRSTVGSRPPRVVINVSFPAASHLWALQHPPKSRSAARVFPCSCSCNQPRVFLSRLWPIGSAPW
jgi:hypothetical protein